MSSSRRISTAIRVQEEPNKSVNQTHNSAQIQQLNGALYTVIRRLQGQLKDVFNHWRRETEHYTLSMEYRQ